MFKEKDVIVVAGPTASGKSGLGIEIARRVDGEIVSADSMQIYRRMDIGTAKVSATERAAVPHHMIDILEPWEKYSVARYVEDASRVCDDILSRGKTPVIVGGTGLYIDSLLSGRDFASDNNGDPVLRDTLSAEYDREGGEVMLEKLRGFDPERAAILHPADKRRIIRAIEIYLLTGTTISMHDAATRALPPRYSALTLILGFGDRQELYARINRRVDDMVERGLFEEVRCLLAEGLSPAATSMQAIGYKEVAEYLSGGLSAQQAVEQIKLGSRRYAKRQLTWFGKNETAIRLKAGCTLQELGSLSAPATQGQGGTV